MHVNADLHIHSKYSMATSPKMDLPTLASESRKK
ncbi:MAG: endonuclease Q family protein, partial [Candidatus Methanoperedenaceae archaeon]|nr:endonuclease Q family protein [Candidatus Methanoperedenaceae archaeon]